MNDKNIFDALRDIDEQWILDAAPGKRRSAASVWAKWGTLAACLFSAPPLPDGNDLRPLQCHKV